ncbi:MAG: hypothetical protein NVS3B1_29590 [Marmoricola sp.]
MALSVPAQRTWAAAYKVTAADMNANVRDAVNFLLNTPFAQVYQNSSQSIPNATYTAVTFDTAEFNNDGAWTSGSNTRWTCQTGGTYRVSAQISFNTNATGIREAQYVVNGGAVVTFNASAVSGAATQVVVPVFSQHFNAGDYIQVNAYQNSGGALTLATGPRATLLSVEYARNL